MLCGYGCVYGAVAVFVRRRRGPRKADPLRCVAADGCVHRLEVGGHQQQLTEERSGGRASGSSLPPLTVSPAHPSTRRPHLRLTPAVAPPRTMRAGIPAPREVPLGCNHTLPRRFTPPSPPRNRRSERRVERDHFDVAARALVDEMQHGCRDVLGREPEPRKLAMTSDRKHQTVFDQHVTRSRASHRWLVGVGGVVRRWCSAGAYSNHQVVAKSTTTATTSECRA